MMTTRSAASSASSWSCVTKMLVTCSSSCRRRSQRRSSLRTLASSAPNGSSSSSTFGLDGERASQRHALPLAAGQLRRVAVGHRLELHELDAAGARAARCPPRAGRVLPRPHSQAERDVLEHRHVPEQGVVLKHEADAPVAPRGARWTSSPSNSTAPASGISRPAISRSSVVLPQPEGPSSATSSPVSTRKLTSSIAMNGAETLADATGLRCSRVLQRLRSSCVAWSSFASSRT